MTSSPYPVLYSFRRCPYAMRARLALAASGQICELREVVLARKPAALREASAKGTVPVLIDSNGQVIDQSLDIMLWALRRHDPRHWLRANGVPLDQMLGLIAPCDGAFKFHLDRYKYPDRFASSDAALHREQGAHYLSQLNTQLLAHTHLTGEFESLADMAIAPFVRQFAHTDPVWFAAQPWPALQSWLTAFEESPICQQVMAKYAPWEEDQAPVLFPDSQSAIK
ncbi:MAG: glutathione S-transferase [Rhodoferax sp.]|nr:glutathione S-transferase [Rhodoferax sp.]